jgi:hypothetical protein
MERDYKYVVSRLNHESLNFLTVQLPRLGKWYDSILSGNEMSSVLGFKPMHIHRRGACRSDSDHWPVFDGDVPCPLFCRTLWYVIRVSIGSDQDKARIIRAYRSFFYLFYKLEVPFTQDQLSAALEKWRLNEQELEEFDFPAYFDDDPSYLRDIVTKLVGHSEDVFTKIHPRHGPGAVAGGEDALGKWETIDRIASLHRVYPRYDTYFGHRSSGKISPAMCGEIIKLAKASKKQEVATSRLIFVPKDSRGPRTISCEPKELMFIQQGVARNLMRLLTANSRGRINFVDQTVNSTLARASSADGTWATVDLQDASDRVSTKLVGTVFPQWAYKYLLALRSENTLLPDGSLFEGTAKYAPMGSALCFPVESVIFWAIAVLAGIKSGMGELDAKADTYVYGDDIIIRPRAFPHFVELCNKFAIKVNLGKSYISGPFRESCGMDAWKGFCVTPIRIKKDISRESPDGNLATAICEYSSNCFAVDYRRTGNYLLQLVNSKYPGILVHCRPLGGLSVVDPYTFLDLSDPAYVFGFDRRLCRVWVRGWVLTTPKEPCRLDGLSRLLRAYYGHWEEHDPSTVAVLRSAKIRKRKILVELLG